MNSKNNRENVQELDFAIVERLEWRVSDGAQPNYYPSV